MQNQIKKFRIRLSSWADFLKKQTSKAKYLLYKLFKLLQTYRRSIAIIVPFLIIVYYVLGSWATHNIDKRTDFSYIKTTNGLAVIDASAGLIKREVDDHMWTANLPFIFPGYVLDNMPQFQTGILRSVRVATQALAKANPKSEDLQEAQKLLKYPANIWLLSKTENLKIAPSSGAQYRKARKALLRFNEEYRKQGLFSEKNLSELLNSLNLENNKISSSLEKQVREFSQDWIDFKADDTFYYNQGRLYGYYIILKALSEDYSAEFVKAELYGELTSLLKTLEDALRLDPVIIRNGEIDSLTAPNHLITLNFYTVKAQNQLNKIIAALKKEQSHAD